MLFIDTFEVGSVPVQLESTVETSRATLPAGDYWIPKEDGSMMITERSTYSDFVGKIKSGRLYKQVEKCLEYSDDVYFVIEGRWSKFAKFPVKSAVGMVASISRKVDVMWLDGPNSTIHFLKYMHDKLAGTKKDIVIGRHVPKALSTADTAKYMLQAVPNVGPKTAEKLLNNRTIADLCVKSLPEMMKYGHYGRELYEALHHYEKG